MAELQASSGNGIIDEARELVDLVASVDSENRREAERDLEYKSGDAQWDERVRMQREAEQRACLIINMIPAHTDQVTNDYAQNPPGIVVHPVDDESDPQTARIITDMFRHIYNASIGENAEEVAFSSAVDTGVGYYRIYTEYVDENSFDQEICLGALPYTFNVYFDPLSVRLDGSDAKKCVIVEEMRRQDFERQYPDAQANSQSLIGTADIPAAWLTEETVQVAEYYKCHYIPDTLLMLGNGLTLFASVLEQDPRAMQAVQQFSVQQQRYVQREQITWHKITAVDILEERVLPGRYIPVIPVYGNRVIVNNKVKRWGLIRFLRDPQTILNYGETTAVELQGLQPRAPVWGPAGFMDGMENDWRRMNTSNIAALEYNQFDLEGRPLNKPERQPFPTPPLGMLEMADRARAYMREISGISQPAALTPGSNRSGRSLQTEDAQAAMATFHYIRNATASKLHAQRIMLSWLPAYYSGQRVLRMLGEDGQGKTSVINKREVIQGVQRVTNDLTIGQYDVVLAPGPSYQTKKEEAQAAIVELGSKWPKLMDVAGSDLVRAMNWPGSDTIAKKLATTEPQVPGEDLDPEQAMPKLIGQLQQTKQEALAINAHAEQLEQALEQQQTENTKLKAAAAQQAVTLEIKRIEFAEAQLSYQLEVQKLQLEASKQETERVRLQVEREKLQFAEQQANAPVETMSE